MNCRDLTGQRFERLIVIERSGVSGSGKAQWLCKCDCGNETIATTDSLKRSKVTSCGCRHKEIVSTVNTTHGMTNTRLHTIWAGMKNRCTNSKDYNYRNYGARGIKVCNEWSNSFLSFYNWALNNGYSGNLTIDRINNNGNYEPSNCKWSTDKEQSNNKRTNLYITYNGITQTAKQWSEELGINYNTIRTRYHKGWPASNILAI